MTENPAPTKVRRGDLVIVHEHHADFGGYDVFRIGLVAGVRKGTVTKWQEASASAPTDVNPFATCHVTAKAEVDVAATLAAAALNPWPHSTRTGRHYDTLDEALEVLVPRVK